MLEHTAMQCKMLQHTAMQCKMLQHTAMQCKMLQHTAMQRKGLEELLCITCLCFQVLSCITTLRTSRVAMHHMSCFQVLSCVTTLRTSRVATHHMSCFQVLSCITTLCITTLYITTLRKSCCLAVIPSLSCLSCHHNSLPVVLDYLSLSLSLSLYACV